MNCHLVSKMSPGTMGARRGGGARGAHAPPCKLKNMGPPPPPTIKTKKNISRGPHIVSEETDLRGPHIVCEETDLRGPL